MPRANKKNKRAPKWARTMMNEYKVSGWELGHAMAQIGGKLKCLSCGEVIPAPPCYGTQPRGR